MSASEQYNCVHKILKLSLINYAIYLMADIRLVATILAYLIWLSPSVYMSGGAVDASLC